MVAVNWSEEMLIDTTIAFATTFADINTTQEKK